MLTAVDGGLPWAVDRPMLKRDRGPSESQPEALIGPAEALNAIYWSIELSDSRRRSEGFMRLFNLSVSLIAFGGSAYALIRTDKIPAWARNVSIATVVISGLHLIMTAIISLPEMAHSISVFRWQISRVDSGPRFPESARDPSLTRAATRPVAVPHPPCVALAMSLTGQWGLDRGEAGCDAHRASAGQRCAQNAGGPCHTFTSGLDWVAGVMCVVRSFKGEHRKTYAAAGVSSAEAYSRAFASARAEFPLARCQEVIASPARASLAPPSR